MNIQEALREVERLRLALEASPVQFSFREYYPTAPFKEWQSTWYQALFEADSVSSAEVTTCYGIYLLARRDTEVFYIGKATPRRRAGAQSASSRYHLGAEIWNKMGEDGPLLSKSTLSPAVRESLKESDILIVAVRIDPWQLSACVESYLQAVADITDGRLPEANDRIG